MRVSREQVAENRQRILDAASRLFRERGFADVSVADVMQAAGLTHGGFYGYFRSKDDLIAEALGHLASTSPRVGDLDAFVATYLSPAHREDRAGGCAVAGLGGEVARQPAAARAAMTEGLRRQIEQLSRDAPGADDAARRRAAIGSWAAMVGAMVLARVSDDPALSDEVFAATRAWLAPRGAPTAPAATRTSEA